MTPEHYDTTKTGDLSRRSWLQLGAAGDLGWQLSSLLSHGAYAAREGDDRRGAPRANRSTICSSKRVIA